MFNWEFKTTFYDDFTIADEFWLEAIKDTYNRAFWERKTDYKYLTELVIVLNWKIWWHNDRWNKEIALLYNDLRWQTDLYAQENLKWEELSYYLSITD